MLLCWSQILLNFKLHWCLFLKDLIVSFHWQFSIVIPIRGRRHFTEFHWCSGSLHHQDSLQWRHNDHDSVSNHQPYGCLLNRVFRRRSKKTSKLRVTGLCVGNSPHKWPVTRKMFPFDDVVMYSSPIILTVLQGGGGGGVQPFVSTHCRWMI